MQHFNSEKIKAAADYDAWIDTMEKALLLKEGDDYTMPPRMHIDFGENTYLLMPCLSERYFSSKLVSVFPANKDLGKPPIYGIVVLNDGNTGEAVATFDGSTLTAMRTAAIGSLAVRHLSPPSSSCLGIIGLGTQGIHQALFACSQRDIRQINIFDHDKNCYENFKKILNDSYPGIRINISGDTRSLCLDSDIIITATNSARPVIPDEEDVLRAKTIIGIGSYKPDMRELPDAVFKLAGRIYVDTLHGLDESGDLIDPMKQNIIAEKDFIPASSLVSVKIKLPETRVFKSVGMALFDLYAAMLIYNNNE